VKRHRDHGGGGGQQADHDGGVRGRGAVVQGQGAEHRETEDHSAADRRQSGHLAAAGRTGAHRQQDERGEDGRHGGASDADEVRVEPFQRERGGGEGERVAQHAEPGQPEAVQRYRRACSSAIVISHA